MHLSLHRKPIFVDENALRPGDDKRLNEWQWNWYVEKSSR
jgi:hypothetical protein